MSSASRSIVITGASSGIGRALAIAYAAPGVHLALAGRDQSRLDETAGRCMAAGAAVTTGLIDVRDRDRMTSWIRAVDDTGPIGLAIASAGISAGLGMGRLREDPAVARSVIATNLFGAINTIDPVVERMCMRGRGRVAVVGSIGAFRGLPSCPAYSVSKAGVHAYAESLRPTLAAQGVAITIIAPGFVETPLNRDIVCPKPLQMTADRAAAIIRRRLDRGDAIIAFPRLLAYGLQLTRLLPRRWVDLALHRIHVDIPDHSEPHRE
jgi:short-subunit dehydrogenase